MLQNLSLTNGGNPELTNHSQVFNRIIKVVNVPTFHHQRKHNLLARMKSWKRRKTGELWAVTKNNNREPELRGEKWIEQD